MKSKEEDKNQALNFNFNAQNDDTKKFFMIKIINVNYY